MYTDPIADYLTRIRNAIRASHAVVEIPVSKMKVAMTSVLKDKGFIRDYRVKNDEAPQGTLQIALKYDRGTKRNAIVELQRVSRPGLRRYEGYKNMPRVLNGLGITILSTSQGVMSDKDALKINVGGEVLCYIH